MEHFCFFFDKSVHSLGLFANEVLIIPFFDKESFYAKGMDPVHKSFHLFIYLSVCHLSIFIFGKPGF